MKDRRVVFVNHGSGTPQHTNCRVYLVFDPKLWIIGICHTLPVDSGTWISDLVVDPQVRRQGIGKLIVDRIRSDRPYVSVLGHSDESAVPFWLEMGAQMDIKRNFYIEAIT